MNREMYQPLITALLEQIQLFYGGRLVTFAIFGSFARNDMRPDSDLDMIIVAEGLPDGRMARSAQFLEIEKKLEPFKQELARNQCFPYLSPIFKTPHEAKRRSPLYLDMTEEIEIYFDRDNFFRNILDAFKVRLRQLGSKRIWHGKMWHWVLKPDSKPGEIIEL